jgi:hypothetical protein
MSKFKELQSLIAKYEKDFDKFYLKNNRSAGIRVRQNMQELRKFAKSIRNEVQLLNNEKDMRNENQ